MQNNRGDRSPRFSAEETFGKKVYPSRTRRKPPPQRVARTRGGGAWRGENRVVWWGSRRGER